jgi:hypothetical protein
MMERPPLQWYRSKIEPMRKATKNLLQIIRTSSKDVKFWSFGTLVTHRMGRSLRGEHPDTDSIEQILEQFERVCAESLRRKGAPGAKQESHVQNAVRALSEIWSECTGSPVPINLDTDMTLEK